MGLLHKKRVTEDNTTAQKGGISKISEDRLAVWAKYKVRNNDK